MKKLCEYRLPCGRCDKFDINCDLTYEQIELMSKIDKDKETNKTYGCSCNHDWQFEYTILNDDGCWEHYYCPKCKKTQITKVIGL